MKIRFKINYKTEFGQVLKITGNIDQLGKENHDSATEMFPINGNEGEWDCNIEVDESVKEIHYLYFVEDTRFEKLRFFEIGEKRNIKLEKLNSEKVEILDFWRSSTNPENVFSSSPFKKIIFNYTSKDKKPIYTALKTKINIIFNLHNFRITENQAVAIYGNLPELGEFDDFLVLNDSNHPFWSIMVQTIKLPKSLRYRYCIIDKQQNTIISEETEDRIVKIENLKKSDTLIINDINFKFRNQWKGAGVAIPVFSLRTNNDHGVGEFLDLKLLIDWAVKVGLKMIQILPVNDTVSTHTWHDSYPYKAISVFALHPIYLNLQAIGSLSADVTQTIIEDQRGLLNALPQIDYEAVMKVKSRFYKMIYDEQKNEFLKNKEYLKFYEDNKYWLVPYAAFSYLRDLFGTSDFSKWGKYKTPSDEILNAINDSDAEHYDDIAVHYFIQFHLHKQLSETANYARKKGIVLKGDIPIGISKNSVDAWMFPQLFNMKVQAGAPPDDFSNEGQNWGFPTYNWEEMEKDNYRWWQMRLKKMSEYFDAFRIDHILGFFRIWEIPNNQVQGLLGYFNPSIPLFADDFSSRGFNFDFFRYATPYIREYMLNEIFGNSKDYVKSNFLVEYEMFKYYFKPEYDTQDKIAKKLNISDADSTEQRQFKEFIQNGLFKLLTEVLFLKYPYFEKETYIPRHSLYKTYSFAALNDNEKRLVMDLYDDYYFRRNEQFWQKLGYEKLKILKSTSEMLICGEDLGMIPQCVPQVMRDLNILSLEIQRMPKDSNKEFTHPDDFPYLSVATASSHDTSTIRGWWEEDTSRSQRFYNQILGKSGNSPFYCEPWIVKDIIVQHCYSKSMWVVFPIQDLLGMDGDLRFDNANEERINNPSNPNHYWRYRMHIKVEDLQKTNDFNNLISNILAESDRS